MKKLMLALIALLFCVSCTTRTEFGPCIGAFDDKDPTRVYKASTLNVILGIIFFETVIAPAIVLLDETLCPVGIKPQEPEGR